MIKNELLQNNRQRNTLAYASRPNPSKYCLTHLNALTHCLVLKFDNVLPMSNQNMVKNVILQRSWSNVKINKTIGQGLFDLKSTHLDTKIISLSALVPNLWSKTSVCKIVVNIMHLSMSHM